jgi:Ser/Thr protein kinase RdoA (MazF antagonist)
MNIKAIQIANMFSLKGEAISAESFGCGHINDTFLVETDEGEKYILQQINTSVFKNPDALMTNIVSVTEFLKKKIAAEGGDPTRETLNVVLTKDGKNHISFDGSAWRVYTFIDDSVTLQTCETADEFYASACGFGHFQKLLADFPAHTLFESIPDFHNTKKRFKAFEEAVESDVAGRASKVAAEIEFVKSRKEFAKTLVDLQKSGKLPLRVTHNDTKLNNVMLTKDLKPLAVVDLDTVMPGLSVNDFGDSIRFGATRAAEDEKDLSKVIFETELFEYYAKGFLKECGEMLTEREKEMLPVGAMMMTFECGMRFLTDYLNGDTYFKVHRINHNLDRCRTQFKLLEQMEEKRQELNSIIKKYA